MAEPSYVDNPVDSVNASRDSFLLSMVYPDTEQLSQKSISLDYQPSYRTLEDRDDLGETEKINSALATVLFGEYILKKMPNALESEQEEAPLNYQLEYILEGKSSDIDNLEAVAEKILLIREGINLAYLLTDSAKIAEAEVLATLIIGYLGNPILVEGLKYALLVSWSFAESVLDVRQLFSGESVPLIKNSQNWKLSLSNLTDYKNHLDDKGEESEDDDGLNYKGYLRLLLYLEKKNTKVMRCMDMMESNIQASSGNSNFRIDNCFLSMEIEVSFHIDDLFLSLPINHAFLSRSEGGYDVTVSRDYSY